MESERPTAELRGVLNVCGRDMLTRYLRKFRTRELWFFFPTPAEAGGGSIKRERRGEDCERGKCDPRDLMAYVICHIGDSVICLILTVVLLFIFPLV